MRLMLNRIARLLKAFEFQLSVELKLLRSLCSESEITITETATATATATITTAQKKDESEVEGRDTQ